MKWLSPLWATLKRSVRMMASRRIYMGAMVVVPLASCVFFVTLLQQGLPVPVPVGVVDCDGSPLSRQTVRTLQAVQSLDVSYWPLSYEDALDQVRTGRTFGFFYIPEGFQQKTFAGKEPSLTFYSNMSIYVPGTFSFKGFKTSAVSVQGGLMVATLTSLGLPQGDAKAMVQPVAVQDHPLNNPWMNYSYYLNPSFIVALLVLMIMLVTVFTLGSEIKAGTVGEWLSTAGGSTLVAVVGKLLPQTLVFTLVGWAIQAICFGFCHNPLNNHAGHLLLAMFMLVVASQAFALGVFELLPNMRLSLALLSLIGVLTFSLDGFSFPVQQMYGGIAIFSWITPMRYYFQIYIDQALNGIPIYWSRFYYIALTFFPVAALLGLPLLGKRLKHPVYLG